MAAAATAISCFLLFIFISNIAAASASQRHERQLQVLSEVVSGPALGRPLALHADAALPVDLRRAVLGAETLRRTPHLTLTLGLNNSDGRRQRQEAAELRLSYVASSSMLHIVLWLTPRPELLQALWLHWKPRNLLLFSLGSSSDTDVLRAEALSGVEKVALIGHLSAEAEQGPDALGVYTVLPFSSSGVQLLGPWRRESFGSWEALFPDRFPSFEGYTFHIAPYIDYPPFIYRPFVGEKLPPQKYGRGVVMEMLEIMAKKLNYSYTITEMVGKWGTIENGSWVGILGTVARHEKNFSISGFYINEERLSGFDPSVGIASDSSVAFVPSPKPLAEWLSILRPFSPSTWASFGAVVAVAVLSMASLERATAGRRRSASPPKGTAAWQDLPRALVTQSIPTLPEAVWKRVFVAVWFLGCLVATAAYTCNLVGIFTSITYQSRLRTLDDLADSHYRLAMVDNGGYTMNLMQSSKGPMYQKMGERMDLFSSFDEAVVALKAGHHVFVTIEMSSKFLILRQMKEDEWYIMEEKFFTGRTYWLFQKNTAWQHKFDESIQQLNYFGLIDYWYEVETQAWIKAHLGTSGRRGSQGDGPAPPLTLRHLQGVFYILGLAWAASGGVLLLELLAHQHQGRLTHLLHC